MRSYPRNSPQAAARIVALAMLADGDLTRTELDALDQLDAHEQLGLDRAHFAKTCWARFSSAGPTPAGSTAARWAH